MAQSSYWIRAPHSGSFRIHKKIGDQVNSGDLLAVISDPFGSETFKVESFRRGIIIGLSTLPLVNRGDAMIHIALFDDSGKVTEALRDFD